MRQVKPGKTTAIGGWTSSVMLSRATRLSDLLLLRAPGLGFLLQGPPKDLSKSLKTFARQTDTCRAKAQKLVRELNVEAFIH